MRIDALQVADEVQVQRAGFYALRRVVLQPGDVLGRIVVLQVAKACLLFEQLARIAQVAVEEYAHAQAQVGNQPLVQVADLGHAGVRQAPVRADLLVFDVLQHSFDVDTKMLSQIRV